MFPAAPPFITPKENTEGVSLTLLNLSYNAVMILLGLTQHQAQGTSLAVMLPPIGILAAWNYHKAGFVDWKYALIISAAFIVGGYLSSKWAVNIDAKTLKKVFGILLLIGGVKLIFGK